MNISHANLDLTGLATTAGSSTDQTDELILMSDDEQILEGKVGGNQGEEERDIWAEMCAAEATQAEIAGRCEQQKNVESCSTAQAAEPKTQDGQESTKSATRTDDKGMVVAVSDSGEEGEADENLEDLLELQSLGIKVVLPTRKRKPLVDTELQEGGEVLTAGVHKKHKIGLGEPATQSKSLSVAEGEQP